MKKFVLLFLLIFLAINLFAHNNSDSIKVENINVSISGNRLYVEYDLSGPIDEEYIVKIILKRESLSSFIYAPLNISGDIGQGKFAGMRKQIIWDMSREFPTRLTGKDFYIEVNAKIIKGGISSWVWGGAAILGGGAAYLLLKKKKEVPNTPVYLPDAPDRP